MMNAEHEKDHNQQLWGGALLGTFLMANIQYVWARLLHRNESTLSDIKLLNKETRRFKRLNELKQRRKEHHRKHPD